MRQRIFLRVAGLRHAVERRAARVGHAEHARHLVKALARRVIARRAEDAELRIVLHVDDHAVPAGHDETEKRRLQLRIGQIVCRNVSPDVMHRHERHAEPQRREFREVHPDKHRADQPRRIRHGHGVDVAARKLCLLQRLIREAVDGLDVLARRDLRHHAAIQFMQLHLRGDAVRQHLAPVAHDGNRRFVAGRFDCQNVHAVKSFLRMRASSFGWK